MSFYGRIVAGVLEGIVEADDPPNPNSGFVHLPNWAGWSVRPSPSHTPTIANGALLWQDMRTAAQVWADIRTARDVRLRATDWRAVHAVDRGGLDQSAWTTSPWRTYRQALRDITNQPDPFNIAWPTPPAS